MQYIELCVGEKLILVFIICDWEESQLRFICIFYVYCGMEGEEKDYGSLENCEINVNCLFVGDDWQDEKWGIVWIFVVLGNEQGYCFGSFVNNFDNDCKLYFFMVQYCGVGVISNDFN